MMLALLFLSLSVMGYAYGFIWLSRGLDSAGVFIKARFWKKKCLWDLFAYSVFKIWFGVFLFSVGGLCLQVFLKFIRVL